MAFSEPDGSALNGLRVRGLLDQAELLAEAIVDTVRESLLVLDRRLSVRLASRSFCLTFGVSPEETLDRSVYELGAREWDIPQLRRLLDEILPYNGSFQDFEVSHDFPNIGRKTMLLNGRRLRRRPDQEELILLAIEDVTALRESQERDAYAAAVLRCSGEALIGLSADGIIQSWNDASTRLFGYTADEVVGSSISILIPANVNGEQADVLGPLGTGQAITTEMLALTKAGRLVTVILNAAPVRAQTGRILGISAALTDITERKLMEQQLRESEHELSELLQEKQTLVRETHHRVKNNLQTIASLLSLHAAQAHDDQVVEALSEAGGRVQAIARLHETLYTSETLAEIHFGEYLRNLTRELRALHGRPEVAVQICTDDIVLALDTAIPLGLIANELILNCFKHAFPGGRSGLVNVSIEYLQDSVTSSESLDYAAVRLRVEDDGVGFPPGLEVGKADSLGLRLVHLLARQLHAEVQAVMGGAGSTFFVSLPAQGSSPEQMGSNSGKSAHSNR